MDAGLLSGAGRMLLFLLCTSCEKKLKDAAGSAYVTGYALRKTESDTAGKSNRGNCMALSVSPVIRPVPIGHCVDRNGAVIGNQAVSRMIQKILNDGRKLFVRNDKII